MIYGGKTTKSLPRIEFPSSFSLSVNKKHYSNEAESIKLLEEVVIPYIIKERESLSLSSSHPALLIMDVFKGQMTDNVLKILEESNIITITVPANLTYLFQPLDVQGGPNGYVKHLMKNKFCDWYARQITQEMDKGTDLEEIEVPLKLSIIKPLHAKWFIEMYNHMTSEEGRKVTLKGWEVSGILGTVQKGLAGLPNLDPFDEIDPLPSSVALVTLKAEVMSTNKKCASYLSNEASNGCDSDDSNDEWIGKDEQSNKNDDTCETDSGESDSDRDDTKRNIFEQLNV